MFHSNIRWSTENFSFSGVNVDEVKLLAENDAEFETWNVQNGRGDKIVEVIDGSRLLHVLRIW
jgi:hypothetical protein